MAFDWSGLRAPAPGTLGAAREVAHCAVQWASKAARANLAPVPDDSHSALAWDAGLGALLSAPIPTRAKAGARVGVHLGALELFVAHDGKAELLALEGCTPRTVDDWLDLKLEALGLKGATSARLPYEIAPRELANVAGLAALARWFAAGAEVMEEVRARHAKLRPGPVLCWPHHFDIALVVPLGGPERSIGIGVSPGDGYYPQPYAYVSPYPVPKDPKLPALPPGGRWHTKGFFGAVATAEALLARPDPRAALLEVIEAAFDASKKWLDG
jgi:hypothetical protein